MVGGRWRRWSVGVGLVRKPRLTWRVSVFVTMHPISHILILAFGPKTMVCQSLLAAATTAIVLRFDGSLRVKHRQSSRGAAVAASCAAAVLRNDDLSICALGGRSLSTDVPGLTSGGAEYSGLILGLEYIQNRVEELWSQETSGPTLSIRGDCKTVIDHCQGFAVPRKLRPQNTMTTDLIQSIERRVKEVLNQKLQVSFELVPREDNQLCDAMCKLIGNREEEQMVSNIESSIAEARAMAMRMSPTTKLPTSAKKRRKFRQSAFVYPLDLMSRADKSLISPEKRLELYKHTAAAILDSDDCVASLLLGEQLRSKSKEMSTFGHSKDDLPATALLFELDGLRKMNLQEDALALERKHRHILGKYGRQLDFISAFAQSATVGPFYDDRAEGIIMAQVNREGCTLIKAWYEQTSSGSIEAGSWVSQLANTKQET